MIVMHRDTEESKRTKPRNNSESIQTRRREAQVESGDQGDHLGQGGKACKQNLHS